MKPLLSIVLIFAFSFLGACHSALIREDVSNGNLELTGPIEVTSQEMDKTSSQFCSIQGVLVDENNETLIGATAKLIGTQLGSVCDFDGTFKIDQIPPGTYTIELKEIEIEKCTITLKLEAGDQWKFEAIIARYVQIMTLKPIIYIYPEEKTEVKVELIYDGELTTTYPKYPENGWNVSAQPDGTLKDEKGKEYYALYWEGKPREMLKIKEGFAVPKEKTIEFLEEKLELLGLNAKEANEFIIFWLPILEKNEYNLISFAAEDYLQQAKLSISPTPETLIRVAMVFQGLDEEIDFPIQDLSPLQKTRKGFTVVEWGGQQLPKN